MLKYGDCRLNFIFSYTIKTAVLFCYVIFALVCSPIKCVERNV